MRSFARLVRSALPTLVGLLSIVSAPNAGVHVVDLAGGGDFTSPGAAMSAAVDGDIILIKPGDYTTMEAFLETNGKALVLVGDTGGTGGTTLLPVLVVSDLPAGKTVVLRHLSFAPTFFTTFTESTVALMNNLGRVHIEDCIIPGWDGLSIHSGAAATPGFPGLRILDSAAVAVHGCTITGGHGLSTTPPPRGQFVNSVGGDAIDVQNAQLSLHQVTATGGHGGSGNTTGDVGTDAGHGLHAVSSAVIVAGCTLQGGDGGAGTLDGLSGSGARSSGAGASFSELDSALLGGAGAPGLSLIDGTHDVWTGAAWTLSVSAPVRSGAVGTVSAAGPASEAFALFFSLGMGYLPKPAWRGAFLPGSPFFGPLIIATTNGNGVFTAPFVAPNLAPFGLEGLLNIDQAIMVQDEGLVLSSATAYIQVAPPN